jgi:hypothetical protein
MEKTEEQLKADPISDRDMIAYSIYTLDKVKNFFDACIEAHFKDRQDACAHAIFSAQSDLFRIYCRLVTQFVIEDRDVRILLSQKVADGIDRLRKEWDSEEGLT